MVSIEEFKQLDFRVGKIIEVKEHEGAKKPMYKLTIDFGEEIGKRTIVAGIRAIYTKEELQDKKIVCVVNLEPKMIAGIESQGMILAADDSSDIVLIVPDKDIKEGSKIR